MDDFAEGSTPFLGKNGVIKIPFHRLEKMSVKDFRVITGLSSINFARLCGVNVKSYYRHEKQDKNILFYGMVAIINRKCPKRGTQFFKINLIEWMVIKKAYNNNQIGKVELHLKGAFECYE